ncbi:haloacid dehalogenase-like hydrolase domain-containing protein At2g33255 [Mangifera indica]|uniref:haloacid dehalogenase-like hydrolase domain-containing protein At2g33255 n=1 Tax=Mangifera indica TaxID=29780 RepID=UPI001CF96D12|nr:haloacid dehalogenase-like hydrolase domain-containing protein At2g33255 [Mangifera indica]
MPSLLSTPFLFLPKTPLNSVTRSRMSTATTASKPLLRGVVFDMDGTLTVPVIDFAAMYKSVLGEDQYTRVKAENPTGIDILHHIENWSPDKQRQAYKIIADILHHIMTHVYTYFGGTLQRDRKGRNNYPASTCEGMADEWRNSSSQIFRIMIIKNS